VSDMPARLPFVVEQAGLPPEGVSSQEWQLALSRRNRVAVRFLAFAVCFATVLATVVAVGG
jgi:hypothetical protein